jgi:hypothetical protein
VLAQDGLSGFVLAASQDSTLSAGLVLWFCCGSAPVDKWTGDMAQSASLIHFEYEVAVESETTLEIYDAAGRLVTRLVHGMTPPGT